MENEAPSYKHIFDLSHIFDDGASIVQVLNRSLRTKLMHHDFTGYYNFRLERIRPINNKNKITELIISNGITFRCLYAAPEKNTIYYKKCRESTHF